MTTAPSPLWQPDAQRLQHSQLSAFREQAEALTGQTLDDYRALHQWSVRDPEAFWNLVWDFCELQGHKGERVLEPSPVFRHNRWFPDARINLAENLLARDGNCCQYCGRHFPTVQLSLDHVVPRSRGGKTNWENVVCSCISCNVKKGGHTPQEARMKLHRKPAKPKHSPLLAMRLGNPKYESWKTYLNTSQWAVELS